MIKNNHAKKRYNVKKIHFTNGHRIAFFSADDLKRHLGISQSYAHRLIKEPKRISKLHRRVLENACFKQIDGFPIGWTISEGTIKDPDGYQFNVIDLENLKHLKKQDFFKSKSKAADGDT